MVFGLKPVGFAHPLGGPAVGAQSKNFAAAFGPPGCAGWALIKVVFAHPARRDHQHLLRGPAPPLPLAGSEAPGPGVASSPGDGNGGLE